MSVLGSLSPEMLNLENVSRWMLDKLHPEGPVCPGCRKPVTSTFGLKNWYQLKRVKCPYCGNHSTAAAGTILASTPFNISQVYLMALLIGADLDRKKIAEIVGVKQNTVLVWGERFAAAKVISA